MLSNCPLELMTTGSFDMVSDYENAIDWICYLLCRVLAVLELESYRAWRSEAGKIPATAPLCDKFQGQYGVAITSSVAFNCSTRLHTSPYISCPRLDLVSISNENFEG